MLTKLRKDLVDKRVTTSDMIQSVNLPFNEPESESDEEVDNTWQPSDTLNDTLKSLTFFDDVNLCRKGKGKLTKKEIRDSFSGFDAWLKSEIYRIVAMEKARDDDKTWGDLE